MNNGGRSLEQQIAHLDRLIKIVELRRDGLTFRQIGYEMGFCQERAMQLFHKAERMAEHHEQKAGTKADD